MRAATNVVKKVDTSHTMCQPKLFFVSQITWNINIPQFQMINTTWSHLFFLFQTAVLLCLCPQVKQAVIWALEAGYRHIDCAAIYANEVEIGEALQEALGPGKVKQRDTALGAVLSVSFLSEVQHEL